MIRRTLTLAGLAAVAAIMLGSPRAVAQETGADYPNWWFGAYGGVNVNMFSGSIQSSLPGTVALPFTGGSGFGMALGAMLEVNGGGLLGGNLMVGYDNRSFDADPLTAPGGGTMELTFSPAYLTIEPNLRVNLGNRWFHAFAGPMLAINAAKGFDYTGTDTTGTAGARSGDMNNVRGLVLGGQAGLGYDLALSAADSRTQVLLTPFVQARLSQDLLEAPTGSSDEVSLTSIRAGVQIKFGIRPVPGIVDAGPVRGAFDFELRAPGLIADNRTLRESFPLRNYIFFDEGSTNLPARYIALGEGDAASFREERLIKPLATTGATAASETRSREQLQVYYNSLNVVGDRLRRNPAATIQLIGAGNGDAARGKLMADNVKAYLVQTFAIDAKRITTQGVAVPANKSGSGGSQGVDARMIAQENNRVEIIGPEDIIRPVNIVTMQEEPIENDVVVTVPNDPTMSSWSVELTRSGDATQTFGPFRNTTTARIGAKALLGIDNEARYTARAVLTTRDGIDITSGTREFMLVRSEQDEEQTGLRFSILFEFDESKTVQTYEKYLAETVAPAVPDGSTVIIHGHTDIIGEPEYNAGLAQRRAEETQRILTRELTRVGKTVTFDTYGFGEDERRAPFTNVLPEHRYYNRTVVIEVLQR